MSGNFFKLANISHTHLWANTSSPLDATVGGATAETYYQYKTQVSTGGIYRGLFLYKGTPMTQAELDAITGSVTSVTSLPRYSDYLLRLSGTTVPSVSGNKMYHAVGNSKAEFTGTATWFIFGAHYSTSFTQFPATVLLSGTVGAVGSGADLELSNLDFVAGNTYKSPTISFTLPTAMNF